jgi:hypothetical protein
VIFSEKDFTELKETEKKSFFQFSVFSKKSLAGIPFFL